MFFDSLILNVSYSLGRRDCTSYLLEPMLTMALAGGPMKVIPSCARRSANWAFSLRKP